MIPSLIKRGTSVEGAVRRWIHDTAIGLLYRDNNRYYELRYEDLVNDPGSTLTRLLNFLGEGTETVEAMLESHSKLQPNTSHGTWSVQTNEPISNKATGKWKRSNYANKNYFEQLFHYTRLSEEVSTKFGFETQPNANEILQAFGYDPTDQWQQNPERSSKLTVHFLQEKFYETLYQQKLYCEVTL